MWADPYIARYIGGRPSTCEQTWSRMLRYAGLWALLGYGYWAIEETATGRFVGEVGFADFKRGLEPPINNVPEAGWVIATAMQGRRYASEALAAALTWADAHLVHEHTVCLISPENEPSLRLAAANLFLEVARPIYKHDPIVLLRRSRVQQS